MTNREFAEQDELFRKACQLAGLAPTKIQAQKFRHHWGRAELFREAAREILEAGNEILKFTNGTSHSDR